jgi:hypothetical protein
LNQVRDRLAAPENLSFFVSRPHHVKRRAPGQHRANPKHDKTEGGELFDSVAWNAASPESKLAKSAAD